MKSLPRLAVILSTAALVALACGSDETATAPIPEVLNTSPRESSGGSWPAAGMAITDVSWRFLSLDTVSGVRGSYQFTWLNQNQTPTKAWWELSFVDSNGFEVALSRLDDFTTIVEPGEPRIVSGSFTLAIVTSITMANSISRMELRASFQFHDLTITAETLPNGIVGDFYQEILDASGGDGPKSWSISGSLPSGLSFGSSIGVINGTPTSVGTSTFAVQVTSGWQTATKDLSISIWNPVTIVSAQPKTGITGELYADTLIAAGGNGVYAWSLSFGSLPIGLSLSPSGVISGVPTVRGPHSFILFEVTSAGSTASSGFLSLRVIDRPQITSSVLSNGQTGSAYFQRLAMTGGDGLSSNNAWSLVSGDLPPGLSLTGSGLISGTPNQAGTWTFRVSVTDFGVSAEGDITITIE